MTTPEQQVSRKERFALILSAKMRAIMFSSGYVETARQITEELFDLMPVTTRQMGQLDYLDQLASKSQQDMWTAKRERDVALADNVRLREEVARLTWFEDNFPLPCNHAALEPPPTDRSWVTMQQLDTT